MTNENALEGDGDGWIVSSFSNDGGACVKVKFAGPGNVLVSDSKDGRHDFPIIDVSSRGWSSLLRDITAAS